MAQPAMADARVSCPVCRSPVHPIAGRCKHCKADLVRARGGSTGAGETPVSVPPIGAGGAPAAAPLPLPSGRGAPMPALTGATTTATASTSTSTATVPAGTSMHAPASATAAPVALVNAPVAHGPGLPTAPAQVHAMAPVPRTPRARRGWGQRWPLAVAIVAAIAIVASLAVLLFGGDDARRKPARALGPAPDRMNTDVGPPPPAAPRTTPDPSPSAPPAATPDPADPSLGGPLDPTPPGADLQDPFAPQPPGAGSAPSDPTVTPVPPPRGPGGIPHVSDAGEFVSAAIDVGCERLLGCLGSSDTAQTVCRQARSMGAQMAGALSSSCTRFDATAAQACLGAIARLPCPKNDAIDAMELARIASAVPACSRMCGP